VADWTIQRHARSGPLMAGGGRLLPSTRDIPAHCFRAPAWRCRPIPVLFASVIPAGMATAASSVFDLNPRCSWLDGVSNVSFAATLSAPEAEPDAVSLLAGGEASGASGKTERAGVWTVEGEASKPGEATGSGRRGSISTLRSRARGSTVNPSLAPASKKKPRPKKTTTVAVATTPREMRYSTVARLGSDVLMPSFGRSEGAPGALADCGPEFRDASCCASSSNACFPSVRRGISRSAFPGKDVRGYQRWMATGSRARSRHRNLSCAFRFWPPDFQQGRSLPKPTCGKQPNAARNSAQEPQKPDEGSNRGMRSRMVY